MKSESISLDELALQLFFFLINRMSNSYEHGLMLNETIYYYYSFREVYRDKGTSTAFCQLEY